MKIYIKCIIAVWAAITGISANAAFTYNPNDNTLTGGGVDVYGDTCEQHNR
jgi:hypothetical protein